MLPSFIGLIFHYIFGVFGEPDTLFQGLHMSSNNFWWCFLFLMHMSFRMRNLSIVHTISYECFINFLLKDLCWKKRDAIWKRISTQCGLTFAYYKNLQWQKKESYHPYFASKTYKSEYFILEILHTKQYLFAFFPALSASYLCLQTIRMSSLLASQLCTKNEFLQSEFYCIFIIQRNTQSMKDKYVYFQKMYCMK